MWNAGGVAGGPAGSSVAVMDCHGHGAVGGHGGLCYSTGDEGGLAGARTMGPARLMPFMIHSLKTH
jgi:hypothetical protein